MLQFTELRLNKECNQLVVGASIKEASYSTNVYIDKIEVCTQSGYNTSTGSITPTFEEQLAEGSTYKYYQWRIDLDMLPNPVGTLNDIFFIKIYSKGVPAEDTPCGEDEVSILGVCYDECKLYTQGIEAINSIEEENICNPTSEFKNYILNYFAFKTNMIAGNFSEAISLWNKLFMNTTYTINKSNCGCYGSH